MSGGVISSGEDELTLLSEAAGSLCDVNGDGMHLGTIC